ncbi:MAG: hypothetical protein KBT68_12695 [bacterium]|nr:hypothetical protein [Candidatus Colisoma equi]
MRMSSFLAVACTGLAVLLAGADEGERETFGKWHIGVGAAFNCGVSANLSTRNMPIPRTMAPVVWGRSRDDARRAAEAREYDGGGFIRPDSDDDGRFTTNWKLPEDTYLGNGRFLLHDSYSEYIPGEVVQTGGHSDEDAMQFGISVEASRELWIHDENDAHRWGVDFAAAFSYFFQRDIYDASGRMSRTDTVRSGDYRTTVDDPDATFFYDMGWVSPAGGMYGYGAYDTLAGGPSLELVGIGPTVESFSDAVYTSARNFSANGDYRELEMLFMFRPWYEITDWWRVFAQVGLGVSWGCFDTSFHSGELSHDEDFSQWDCYGVAGLGTAFRYDDWTLGADFLWRFLRDDFDVDGRYVNGSIERSNWGFRVMLGYEF